MKKHSKSVLQKIAKDIALLILDISFNAKTGHVGSALSISDILATLYFSVMKSKDKFILSKGHAAAALYATLYKKGILSRKELDSFGQDGGLCEHPEVTTPGVEMTTGSLGHGLAFGIGIAQGQKLLGSGSRTFVLISDGESNEGSIWEAALLAPQLKLDNLIAIVDYNRFQCLGETKDIINLDPLDDKWSSFGWEVKIVDGHDTTGLSNTLSKVPFKKGKPSLVIAQTTSGKGIPLIENQLIGHYKVFSEQDYRSSRENLEKL